MSGPLDPNPRSPEPAQDTDGRGSANDAASSDAQMDPNVEAVTAAFEGGREVEREAVAERGAGEGESRVEGEH